MLAMQHQFACYPKGHRQSLMFATPVSDRGKSFSVDISSLVCVDYALGCVGPQLGGAKYCKSKNGAEKS